MRKIVYSILTIFLLFIFSLIVKMPLWVFGLCNIFLLVYYTQELKSSLGKGEGK
jgi:hypothetical protein